MSRIRAGWPVSLPFIAFTFITFPMLCWAIHWCNLITAFRILIKMNESPNFKSRSAGSQSRENCLCGLCPGEKFPWGAQRSRCPAPSTERALLTFTVAPLPRCWWRGILRRALLALREITRRLCPQWDLSMPPLRLGSPVTLPSPDLPTSPSSVPSPSHASSFLRAFVTIPPTGRPALPGCSPCLQCLPTQSPRAHQDS